ncbi:MAG: YraN family protein [Chromatiales bacterium]|jgi:putative endonuclease|nr:YraN family protein [Chromatiales bacterium]
MPPTHLTKGKKAEALAADFLTSKGLRILERNYLCRVGEIDLVAQDGTTVVFAEVRYRSQTGYGGAIASVTRQKQHRIARAAAHYLQARRLTDVSCRFDVIALGPAAQDFDWIPGAFEVDSWT